MVAADVLDRLIASADAVIGDQSVCGPAGGYPDVVFCSVTRYGIQAPAELQNAKSLNVFHSSGWGFHTPSHADQARPPLRGPGRFLAVYDPSMSFSTSMKLTGFQASPSSRSRPISSGTPR